MVSQKFGAADEGPLRVEATIKSEHRNVNRPDSPPFDSRPGRPQRL
jgi:hypothetical protein